MSFIMVNATTRPTATPPRCVLPSVCIRGSPRVCGRNPQGQCQRYNNICELLESNRQRINVGVVHVRDGECRTVRGVGGSHRRPCYRACPPRPVVCKQTPASQHICVRTRNNRECKVLANRCQLRNQNCHARPRNNWLRTDRRRCGKLTLGDKPHACLNIPIITIEPRTPTRSPPCTSNSKPCTSNSNSCNSDSNS
ncbi:uncharacterized protein Dwil_GK20030 [Drosophila willistoni]|uniref:Kazal-like domain-containing protein n=1 Tax=Drosophila willistoni TaxID=7260 RepID=B4MST4_DROWI|nr:uncharacterized protein Dwil_GK20030 [Drosophila willistoni]